MFTDIKGFTEQTSAKKRDEFEEFLDIHEKLVTPIFKEHHGRIVKTIGDAFMVVFHSPTNAVLCGMKIQDVLKKYNEDSKNKEKVEVRVAISSGEVHIRGNDIFGEAVNIASRIEGIAEANEIYFTESVYLSMNKSEIPTAEIGYRRLKGIPEEIKVYKVVKENEKKGKQITKIQHRSGLGIFSRIREFWKRRKRWIIAIFFILLFIGIVTNPKNIIKKEENIDKFIDNAERVIQAGNYEEAQKLVGKLEQLPKDQIPPKIGLEGAKLYIFLRQPAKAVEMIQIAKNNFPTKEESQEINNFISETLKQASPEQKEKLNTLLKQ